MDNKKNLFTWLVQVWLDNDAVNYYTVTEMIDEIKDDYPDDNTAYLLSERLKDKFEAMAFDVFERACMLNDLLMAALAEVNWYEIASGYVETWEHEHEEDDDDD